MAITLMLILFVLFLVLGIPVAHTLGIVSLLFVMANSFPLSLLSQRMFVGMDSFPLMALPLFLLAGNLMNTGGVTDRLWKFARTIIGFIPGGMGHVSVLSSMLFASMSGSALATAGGLGPIQIKGMVEDGFRKDTAAAITAAASTIGPIIPPSIVFVLYGVLGGISVGKLFLAGVVPGILMGLSLMGYVLFLALTKREQLIVRPFPDGKAFLDALKDGILPLLSPIIILGGILGGVFTPTEAAAVASAYSLFLGFLYREMDLKSLFSVLKDTARTSASIMLIIGFASSFSWLLTSSGASRLFVSFVLGAGVSRMVILILLNLALLIVGCFVETNSAVVLLTPLLVPAMTAVGIDPVHLGIILCVNLLIGILTPPMGMAIYVVSKVASVPFHQIVRSVIPLIGCLVVVQLIVTFIPQVSLFLPNLLMR
jgi:tripartite ATP-independent transporter DctM subunit